MTTIIPAGMKVCPHKDCPCQGQPQPLDAFGRNDSRHDGKAFYCRKCASRMSANWKKTHPEQDREWRKAYAERNRARNKAARDAAAADETRYVETD